MKYFKFHWKETSGDEYDSWGTSIWYLELDNEWFPTKQIEAYDNGIRLKYHLKEIEDKYGMLGDQSISIEEINQMKAIEISPYLFEKEWKIEAKLPNG